MRVKHEMPLGEWYRKKFPGGRPTLRALQKQCARGDIRAVKRGSWYVLVDENEKATGDALVDMVLSNGRT